jgi:hypothetical protein
MVVIGPRSGPSPTAAIYRLKQIVGEKRFRGRGRERLGPAATPPAPALITDSLITDYFVVGSGESLGFLLRRSGARSFYQGRYDRIRPGAAGV